MRGCVMQATVRKPAGRLGQIAAVEAGVKISAGSEGVVPPAISFHL